MKYLSIDIETGGLDPEKYDLLELGIVAETGDPDTAVEDLPSLRLLFPKYDEPYRLSTWAVEHHGSLLAEMQKMRMSEGSRFPNTRLIPEDSHPERVRGEVSYWQSDHSSGRLSNLAGKNLGSFDIPFIEEALDCPMQWIVPHHRRILDPAILYARPEDETLPDLAECRRRGEKSGLLIPLTEEQKAAHTSLGDCREVIRLLRAKNI